MSSRIGTITSSAEFTWKIRNFSNLNTRGGHRSEVFSVGSYQWRILMYPEGMTGVNDQLSLFLVREDRTRTPLTEYSFTVNSQTNERYDVEQVVEHKFRESDTSWGWKSFMKLNKLHDPSKGYLVNDSCFIQVKVSCEEGSG